MSDIEDIQYFKESRRDLVFRQELSGFDPGPQLYLTGARLAVCYKLHPLKENHMPQLRSRTSTHGRIWLVLAPCGGLLAWVKMISQTDHRHCEQLHPIVPGHVHLKDLGDIVAEKIKEAGGVSKEFNTIAVDDGIAMGHGGMLYSLPSREIIADSIEYMVNAHCADALVCISNCDKITPGMLLASMRLNIPVVFVSGGPMEAGKVVTDGRKGPRLG